MSSHHRRPPHKHNRQLPRLFYRWHRRIGTTAALFLIWIVISGWMLNHSDSLGLAQHNIHSPALAHWYNLSYQPPRTQFRSKDHWLAATDDTALLDGKNLAVPLSEPLGLIQTDQLVVAANARQLILLSPVGELIDKLETTNLPISQIAKIGTGCQGIAIADSQHAFASSDGIDWQACTEEVNWSSPEPLSGSQLQQIEPLLVPGISLEKVVLDLHTGRFFGRFGAYVVDAIGACLLLLALSGLWLFFRMRQKK